MGGGKGKGRLFTILDFCLSFAPGTILLPVSVCPVSVIISEEEEEVGFGRKQK